MNPVRIHVRQPAIRANQAGAEPRLPVISVARPDRTDVCSGVEILHPDGTVVATFVYSPDSPMEPSGATVWVETELEVRPLSTTCPRPVEEAA